MPHTISRLVYCVLFYFIVTIGATKHIIYVYCENVVKMQIRKHCVFSQRTPDTFLLFHLAPILFGPCARNIYIGKSNTTISVQALSSKRTHKHVKFNLHVSDFYYSSKCNYWQFICASFLVFFSLSLALCCSCS